MRSVLTLTWALGSLGAWAQEPAPCRTPAGPPRAAQPTPRARIRGKVFLGEREKVACRVTLCLFGEGLRGERVVPLSSGSFDLGVEGDAGRLEWALLADGHDPARGVVEWGAGGAADLGEVILPRGSGVLEGRVTDARGLSVAGATIRLHGRLVPAPPRVGEPENSMGTDVAGRFRIERVPAGKGFVEVQASNLPAIPAAPVEMRPWDRRWLELTPLVGSLGLSVRCERGEWDRAFGLGLVDEEQGMHLDWTVRPPREEASWGLSCGRFA
ncbi:MAG TPA: carboxypeptidase-like regulatory domain-containing protein [Planctomycetota bacterium]|nr:carboxypeptidase-like regulatory domain-containing protein [Planctomycetota bacterium]